MCAMYSTDGTNMLKYVYFVRKVAEFHHRMRTYDENAQIKMHDPSRCSMSTTSIEQNKSKAKGNFYVYFYLWHIPSGMYQ